MILHMLNTLKKPLDYSIYNYSVYNINIYKIVITVFHSYKAKSLLIVFEFYKKKKIAALWNREKKKVTSSIGFFSTNVHIYITIS